MIDSVLFTLSGMPSTLAAIQTDFVKLILEASLISKIVLVVLLGFSVVSWAIIAEKFRVLRRASRDTAGFLQIFRESKKLSEVRGACEQYSSSPSAGIFLSGFAELKYMLGSGRAKKENRTGPDLLDLGAFESVSRACRRANSAELARLEKALGFLATTASVSPYIGLFGTVFGIINAFHGIGVTGSANLATVAPGISEALIATAAGLAAAIPAVIAYNHFLHRIKQMATEMDDFSLEFLNIIERNLASSR